MIDLDDLEDLTQRLSDLGFEDIPQMLADGAAASPAIRARLDAAAHEARRWLAEAEAWGIVRGVRDQDGTIVAIEMLARQVH